MCVVWAFAVWCSTANGFAASLVDGLATQDRRGLELAVEAIERAPATTADLASTLLVAARACETRLADPVRALALYARIGQDFPNDSSAWVAARRAEQLRSQVGAGGEQAKQFSELVAQADRVSADEVSRRATALAEAAWPGAPEVALWVAGYFQRLRRFREADQRYADVIARWPSSRFAIRAARARAGAALESRAWDRAAALAEALPNDDPSDVAIRAEVLHAAGLGAARATRYVGAWIAVGIAVLTLMVSLAQVLRRSMVRPGALWLPFEVLFLAPIGIVLVGASFTAHNAIGPAVLRIVATGIVLAWISGTGLDLARANGHSTRMRSIVHAATCALGAIAIGYIAVVHDGLLDMLLETVRFGPENR